MRKTLEIFIGISYFYDEKSQKTRRHSLVRQKRNPT